VHDPHFLIDECLTPLLKITARDFGYNATSAVDVGLGGETDLVLFTFAQAARLVVVTNNGRDFRRLARAAPTHSGLIIMSPNLPRAGQIALFQLTLEWLQPSMDIAGRIVDIRRGAGGEIFVTDAQ
jgi:predicted nuclease of predicted toxin-antitoxin system